MEVKSREVGNDAVGSEETVSSLMKGDIYSRAIAIFVSLRPHILERFPNEARLVD